MSTIQKTLFDEIKEKRHVERHVERHGIEHEMLHEEFAEDIEKFEEDRHLDPPDQKDDWEPVKEEIEREQIAESRGRMDLDSICPYASFRPGQKELIRGTIEGFESHKFVSLAGPTGCGKSLIGTVVAWGFPKAIYTTPQVGLVEQIAKDDALRWSTVVGKRNYDCRIEEANCAEGQCNFLDDKNDKEMFYRKYCPPCYPVLSAIDGIVGNHACEHRIALQDAVYANYSLLTFQLLLVTLYLPAYNHVWARDLLIIDEAQDAEQFIRNFYTITIRPHFKKGGVYNDVWERIWERCKETVPLNSKKNNISMEWEDHKEWLAHEVEPLISDAVDELPRYNKKEYILIRDRLEKIIDRINDMKKAKTEFIPVPVFDDFEVYKPGADQSELVLRKMEYKPLRISEYFENITRPFKKVLLMGATVTDFDLKEFGVEDVLTLNPPPSFPKKHRQIYYKPVGSMSHRNKTPETVERMAKKVLNIIDHVDTHQFFNWKIPVNSVVHCVSAKLQSEIAGYLPKDKIMVTPNGNAAEKKKIIDEFKKQQGKILVSTACMTGFDFPDDAARLNFIIKIPYMPVNDYFVQVRRKQKDGKEWYRNETVKTLVQGAGRTTRSFDDSSFTFILDSDFFYIKRFVPQYFREAIAQ